MRMFMGDYRVLFRVEGGPAGPRRRVGCRAGACRGFKLVVQNNSPEEQNPNMQSLDKMQLGVLVSVRMDMGTRSEYDFLCVTTGCYWVPPTTPGTCGAPRGCWQPCWTLKRL